MNIECKRLEDRHGNKYLLIAEYSWDGRGPVFKAFLRDETRAVVAFNSGRGFFPDSIEWAEKEIAAMSRHGGNYHV